MPGRYCVDGWQCASGNCKKRESTCIGLDKDASCWDDSNCGVGLYCRTAQLWPYETRCSKLRSEYEQCASDTECQNHQYCWYPNEEHSKSDRKTCMPIYSQEDGTVFGWKASSNDEPTEADFLLNGKYCQSGLAYPINENSARCTSFKEMRFDDKVIEEPFPCSPRKQEKTCALHFNIEKEDEAYALAK